MENSVDSEQLAKPADQDLRYFQNRIYPVVALKWLNVSVFFFIMETTLSKLYLLCNFSNSDQYLTDYAKCLDYSRTYVLTCQKSMVSIGLAICSTFSTSAVSLFLKQQQQQQQQQWQ